MAAAAATGCGSKTPQDLLTEAEEVAQGGDVEGALEIAKKVKDMPLDEVNYGLVRMLLGKYYIYNNDFEAARKEFQEIYSRFRVDNPNPVLAKQARDASVNLVYGWLYQANEPEKAWAQVQETSATLSSTSTFSRDLSRMASEVLYTMKRYDEAFQEVIGLLRTETDPSSTLDLLDRAAVIRLGEERWDEAAQVYLDFAKTNPDRYLLAEMNLRAGLSYPEDTASEEVKAKRDGFLRQAQDLFRSIRAGETDPDAQSQLYVRESTAAWAQGDKVFAEDCLTSVTQRLAVNPDIRGIALLGLAQFKLAEEEYDAALGLYRQLQREFPKFQEQATQGIVYVNRKVAEKAVLGAKGKEGESPSQPQTPLPPASEALAAPASGGSPAASLPVQAEPAASAPTARPNAGAGN